MEGKNDHKKLMLTSTKPEKKIEEKKTREAVQVAESLTAEGVGKSARRSPR